MPLNEKELINKAISGDAIAFEELVYRYDKHVLSIALKYVNDRDDAKDIYQEVFIRVYKGLKNFQFKSEFSTWLFRITTNVCLSYKSQKTRREYYPIDEHHDEDEKVPNVVLKSEESEHPDNFAIDNEMKKLVDAALNSLAPKQKLSFILKHYEGYKIREIAEMMDCQEGTVKKYLFDAVHKLRILLEEFI